MFSLTPPSRRPHKAPHTLALLGSLTLALWTHSARATPPVAARLAILEFQGDYGELKERQRWADHARAAALRALQESGVRVIDRADFVALLPPNERLESCVGQCSAQVAQRIGAHWALSAQVDSHRDQLHLTFKLHSADGSLLSVRQGQLLRAEAAGRLPSLIKQLTTSALTPISPLSALEEPLPEPTPELDPGPSAEPPPHRDVDPPIKQSVTRSALRWWMPRVDGQTRCLSERVRWRDYQRCVDAGACTPPPSRARCTQTADQAVRCVDLSQALSYIQWLQQSGHLSTPSSLRALPTHLELQRLYTLVPESLTPSGEVSLEWVVTEQSPTSPKGRRALKVAPKELMARATPYGDVLAQPAPPAFQLPQLGFRLSVLSSRSGCPKLP